MDDSKLLQNTLAEATTEQGFPTKVGVPLQKEVTLEDGTVVIVEGITPNQMKNILNQTAEEPEEVTFKTPGEVYENEDITLKGVVQIYNGSEVSGLNVIKSKRVYDIDFLSKVDVDKLNKLGAENVPTDHESTAVFIVNNDGEGYINDGIHILSFDPASEPNKLFSLALNVAQDEIGGMFTESIDIYLYDELYERFKDRILKIDDFTQVDTESYQGEGWYKVIVLSGDLTELSTITVAILEKIDNSSKENYLVKRILGFHDFSNPTEFDELSLNKLAEVTEIIAELPDEIPWDGQIKDTNLADVFIAYIYIATENEFNFILKQGNNEFECYMEPSSELSADIYLKEDPENNQLSISILTDEDDPTVEIMIDKGFEDLVIGR